MDNTALKTALADAALHRDPLQLATVVQQAKELFPEEAFTLYYQSVAKYRAYDLEGAAQLADNALAKEPDNDSYIAHRAQIHTDLGEETEAKTLLEGLIAKQPNSLAGLCALASLHMRNWETEAALQYANQALALDANHVPALATRGYIHQVEQRLEEAVADLNKAVEFDPQHAEHRQRRAAVLEQLGQLDAAKADLKALIELERTNPEHYLAFGRFAVNHQQPAEALESLNELLYLDIENPEGYLLRGRAYRQLEQFNDAIADFRSAQVYLPNSAELYSRIAEAQAADYDAEGGIATLTEALERPELDSPWALLLQRGKLYLKEYDTYRAEEDFNQAGEYTFGQSEAFFQLGCIYQERGELGQAYSAWKFASDAGNSQAYDKILEFCGAQLADEALEREAIILFEHEGFLEQNRQSELIKTIGNKFWKCDQPETVKRNPMLKEAPAEMRDLILDAFNKMVFFITPQGLILLNPEQDDVRAAYQIESESTGKASLLVQPLTGAAALNFGLELQGKVLTISGLAGGEVELNLSLVETPLGSPEKAAFAKRKQDNKLRYLSDKLAANA